MAIYAIRRRKDKHVIVDLKSGKIMKEYDTRKEALDMLPYWYSKSPTA